VPKTNVRTYAILLGAVLAVAPAAQAQYSLNERLLDAARYGQAESIERLLAHGADINTQDETGQTPLMAAIAQTGSKLFGGNPKKYVATIDALLAHNPNLEVKDRQGQTALFHAVLEPNEKVIASLVLRLVDKGAKLDVADGDGATALIELARTARAKSPEVAKLLLEHDARLDAKDLDGKTALDYANHTGPSALVDEIEKVNRERKLLGTVEHSTPEEQLKIYVEAVKRDPENQFARNRVLQTVLVMKTPPEVPEDVRKLLIEARITLKREKKAKAMQPALELLRKAEVLAPWWEEPYYDLALALQRCEKFDEAIAQMNFYLTLRPHDFDAGKVRARLVNQALGKKIEAAQ
jgi:tetratricopeptide (TPR) repeat protein